MGIGELVDFCSAWLRACLYCNIHNGIKYFLKENSYFFMHACFHEIFFSKNSYFIYCTIVLKQIEKLVKKQRHKNKKVPSEYISIHCGYSCNTWRAEKSLLGGSFTQGLSINAITILGKEIGSIGFFLILLQANLLKSVSKSRQILENPMLHSLSVELH